MSSSTRAQAPQSSVQAAKREEGASGDDIGVPRPISMPDGYWQYYGMARPGPLFRSGAGPVQAADPGAAFAAATASGGVEVPYRAEMEHSFGQRFDGVQAHLGRGEELRSIGAQAAAQGDRVAFASTQPSKEVVAHELAHVAQQRQAGTQAVSAKSELSDPSDAAEREADAVAPRAAAGERVTVSAAPSGGLHRLVLDESWNTHLAEKAQVERDFQDLERILPRIDQNKLIPKQKGSLKTITTFIKGKSSGQVAWDTNLPGVVAEHLSTVMGIYGGQGGDTAWQEKQDKAERARAKARESLDELIAEAGGLLQRLPDNEPRDPLLQAQGVDDGTSLTQINKAISNLRVFIDELKEKIETRRREQELTDKRGELNQRLGESQSLSQDAGPHAKAEDLQKLTEAQVQSSSQGATLEDLERAIDGLEQAKPGLEVARTARTKELRDGLRELVRTAVAVKRKVESRGQTVPQAQWAAIEAAIRTGQNGQATVDELLAAQGSVDNVLPRMRLRAAVDSLTTKYGGRNVFRREVDDEKNDFGVEESWETIRNTYYADPRNSNHPDQQSRAQQIARMNEPDMLLLYGPDSDDPVTLISRLAQNGAIAGGAIYKVHRTSHDHGPDYSVKARITNMTMHVLHAHINGTTHQPYTGGPNPVHVKKTTDTDRENAASHRILANDYPLFFPDPNAIRVAYQNSGI